MYLFTPLSTLYPSLTHVHYALAQEYCGLLFIHQIALESMGYLMVVSASEKPSEEDYADAIVEYQNFYGLKATGATSFYFIICSLCSYQLSSLQDYKRK